MIAIARITLYGGRRIYTLDAAYQTKNGKLYHCDNLDGMKMIIDNSVDSCISDFPYDLSFMGKKWDTKTNFYKWNKLRAIELLRILKPGGYCAIFGHPKTNHRMKSAFEDVGFKIVEEIDWIYFSGMPKNQDIGKLFDKAGKPEFARKYLGFKTSGLKPAHEPITIFQKPLDGTYIQNIEKHGCGAMNINACRVPISNEDIEMLNKKASKNPTTNYSDMQDKVYGAYAKDMAVPANELGRFPSNIIMDEYAALILDEQTGISKSTGGSSRIFTVIKYCPKISPSERKLTNGERNPHVTLKPIALIKWLIKLLTPIDGFTIDITSGSGTHSVACEELNSSEGYNLKWVNIELQNSSDEPYVNTAIARLSNDK